jgi:hypothetical protein
VFGGGRSAADDTKHKISKQEGIRYFVLQDGPVLRQIGLGVSRSVHSRRYSVIVWGWGGILQHRAASRCPDREGFVYSLHKIN